MRPSQEFGLFPGSWGTLQARRRRPTYFVTCSLSGKAAGVSPETSQLEKVLAAHAWDSGGLDTDRDRDVGKSGGF